MGSKLLRIILPTQTELIIYIFVSLLVLTIINATAITSLFVDSTSFSLGLKVITEKLDVFLQLIDSLHFTSTFALALFWAMFGTALYIFGFTLYELFSETKHEIKEASGDFHHPTYLRHESLLVTVLVRSVIRIITSVVIVAYTFVVVGFILPICSQLVYDVTFVERQGWYALNPLIGIALFALSLHVVTILLRLLFLRQRLGSHLEPN